MNMSKSQFYSHRVQTPFCIPNQYVHCTLLKMLRICNQITHSLHHIFIERNSHIMYIFASYLCLPVTKIITTRAFAYAFIVFSLSTLGLALALANNLEGGTRENPFNIPVQIDASVRIGQYVAIMVGE